MALVDKLRALGALSPTASAHAVVQLHGANTAYPDLPEMLMVSRDPEDGCVIMFTCVEEHILDGRRVMTLATYDGRGLLVSLEFNAGQYVYSQAPTGQSE